MRRFTRDDIAAVREIDRLCFSENDQYDGALYERLVCSHEHEAFVAALLDGTITGWILANLTRQPLRIQSISVHPSFRRRGLGRALITEILRRHRTEVDLLVDPSNSGALRLYQRIGFVRTTPDPELPERIRMIRRP